MDLTDEVIKSMGEIERKKMPRKKKMLKSLDILEQLEREYVEIALEHLRDGLTETSTVAVLISEVGRKPYTAKLAVKTAIREK